MSAPDVDIGVVIQDDGWRAIADLETVAHEAAEAALRVAAFTRGPAELSLAFAGDAEVAALNERWRGKSGATNVLSFALDVDAAAVASPVTALGDVVLARETVIAEAERDGRRVLDHAAHLVVHGVLHLLGYDHENDNDAARMESAETAAMRAMKLPDPYAERVE